MAGRKKREKIAYTVVEFGGLSVGAYSDGWEVRRKGVKEPVGYYVLLSHALEKLFDERLKRLGSVAPTELAKEIKQAYTEINEQVSPRLKEVEEVEHRVREEQIRRANQ